MIYAITEQGERIEPTPNQKALCPGCRASVISKCGEVYAHYWAHQSGCECDPWHEPETPWHTGWKKRFEKACREVVIGPHRADVRATFYGLEEQCVIELQHSAIEPDDIRDRETFYKTFCDFMLWVIDVSSIKDHFTFTKKGKDHNGATITASFKWKWFRKRWSASNCPQYLDFGDQLWVIESIDEDGNGEARSLSYHQFLSMFQESIDVPVPVHWHTMGNGSLLYRFGLGNVMMYRKTDLYQFAVFWNGGAKKFSQRAYKTIEDAKRQCEPHLGKYMKRHPPPKPK